MTLSDITANAPLVFAGAVALGMVGGIALLIVAQIGRQLGPGKAPAVPAAPSPAAQPSAADAAPPVLSDVVAEATPRKAPARPPAPKAAAPRTARPSTRLDDPLAAAAAEGLGAFVVSDDAALAEMRALREGVERFEPPASRTEAARVVDAFVRETSPQDERRDAVLSGHEDRMDNTRAAARVEPEQQAAAVRGRALGDSEYDPSDFASRRDDSGPDWSDRPMSFPSSFGLH